MAYNIIRPRRGIKSLWDTYKSRIYQLGEMLVESPESGIGSGPVNIKFGDGTTDYENLPYAVFSGIRSVTLTANAWVGDAAPYTQTANVPGITANDNPILVSMLQDGANESTKTGYSKAFDCICSGTGTTTKDSVTFKVYDKPEIDITVGLKGV